MIAGGGSPTHLDLGRRAADPLGLWAAGRLMTHLDIGQWAADPPLSQQWGGCCTCISGVSLRSQDSRACHSEIQGFRLRGNLPPRIAIYSIITNNEVQYHTIQPCVITPPAFTVTLGVPPIKSSWGARLPKASRVEYGLMRRHWSARRSQPYKSFIGVLARLHPPSLRHNEASWLHKAKLLSTKVLVRPRSLS